MLRGLPHNVTTEMDLALWDVANRIRTDPAAAELMRTASTAELVGRFHAGTLPPVAAEAVAGFLARYGERAVAEIDLGLPRWSEDPAHVLGVIANYLRLDDPALAPDALFAKGAAEAEQTIDALSRRAGGCAAGWCGSPSVGPGRWPVCASCRSTTWSRRLPPPRGTARRRRGRADPAVGSPPPTTSSSSRSPKSARRSSICASSSPGVARSTTASCGAGTSPGLCSPTAPSPKPWRRRTPGWRAP